MEDRKRQRPAGDRESLQGAVERIVGMDSTNPQDAGNVSCGEYNISARKWSVLDDICRIGDLIDKLEGNWAASPADAACIGHYLRQRASYIDPAMKRKAVAE